MQALAVKDAQTCADGGGAAHTLAAKGSPTCCADDDDASHLGCSPSGPASSESMGLGLRGASFSSVSTWSSLSYVDYPMLDDSSPPPYEDNKVCVAGFLTVGL